MAEEKTMTVALLLGQNNVFNDRILDFLVKTEWNSLTEDQRRVMKALAVFNHHVPTNAIAYLTSPFFPEIQVEAWSGVLLRKPIFLSFFFISPDSC